MEHSQQKRLDDMKEGLMGVESQPLKTTEKQVYETGAQRGEESNRGRYDLISAAFLKRLAIHLEKGAKHYAPRNWEKGLPIKRSFNSLLRHALQWHNGDRDEDHLAAVACNLMFILHTEELIRDGKLPASLLEEMPPSYFESRGLVEVDGEIKRKIDTESVPAPLFSGLCPDFQVSIAPGNNVYSKAGGTVTDRPTVDEMSAILEAEAALQEMSGSRAQGSEAMFFDLGHSHGVEGIEPVHGESLHYMSGYRKGRN